MAISTESQLLPFKGRWVEEACRCRSGPTCEGRCQALEAVWLLQLLAHLRAIGLVLAQDGTALLQPPQGLEGLQLLLQHGSRAAGVVGQLHGYQRENLRQVVLQCVTDDAILLVETGPT